MVLFNPKCKTLFRRNLDTFKVTNELTDQRYAQVKDWLVTEKMDGMSVILSINTEDYTYFGRSRNTNFNAEQQQFMDEAFHSANYQLFKIGFEKPVDIYAELVGPGIQGNPHNLDALELFVFDVRVNDFWLDWDNVCDIAEKAGLQTVSLATPDGERVSAEYVVSFIDYHLKFPQDEYCEGFVARTDPYLYDNMGNRIMWKLKVSDY